MQEKGNNIIKLKYSHKNWKTNNDNADVIKLKDKKLFINATLVDFQCDTMTLSDILVKGGKIVKICPHGEIEISNDMDVINLYCGYVLPSFQNKFSMRNSYLAIDNMRESGAIELVESYMKINNILAGGGNLSIIPNDKALLIENIADMSEAELEELSNNVAKKNQTLFLHVGLSLDELGSVEKKFGKPLVNVLEDFGFLDRNWVLVGGNCLEKDDFQILSQYGNKVVICPFEDAQMGRRTLNLRMLKNFDFDISFGSGSTFEIDFFSMMRACLSFQWNLFEECSNIDEKDVLLMATGGQTCLEEGMEASFVVISAEPSLYDNLWKYLVWSKTKDNIFYNVQNGKIVLSDGFIHFGGEKDYFQLLLDILNLKENEKDDD